MYDYFYSHFDGMGKGEIQPSAACPLFVAGIYEFFTRIPLTSKDCICLFIPPTNRDKKPPRVDAVLNVQVLTNLGFLPEVWRIIFGS